MSDISSVLTWWLTMLLLTVIFTPAAFLIFKRFIDKGYILGKVMAILISSYLIWLFASFHLLPFTRISIFAILAVSAVFNIYLFHKNKKGAKIPWKWIILEECLFLSALTFWSYVRATEPSIRGLEKFMDFGFVNSILRAKYFPPLDMWLSKSPEYAGGNFINYYYFGHYINAFLTKLSGLNSAITYNLMMATLFALTFTLPFSLAINLCLGLLKSRSFGEKLKDIDLNTKLVIIGLLAGFIVSLGGNLHTIYSFTNGYPNENPEPFWRLKVGFHPEKYWYPNATRFIPYTIHEFPIYSFVVADLHGHVSDIPLVFLAIATLYSFVLEKQARKRSRKKIEEQSTFSPIVKFFQEFKNHTSFSLTKIAFLGLIIGSMYMTNAWDGMIYLGLSGFVFLTTNFVIKQKEPISFWGKIYKTFSASLFLFFFFLLASLPFSLNFKLISSSIGVLCAPAFLIGKQIGPFVFEQGKCQKSPLYMLAILWGFFYYNVFGFLLFVFLPKLKDVFLKSLGVRSAKVIKKLKKVTLAIPHSFAIVIKKSNLTDIFILLMILLSTLLLIFPEFFYMKDIYPAHYRANTMFKLGYQAFMMLGLSCSYIFFRLKLKRNTGATNIPLIIYNVFYILLFALVAIYPYFAINSYYGGLKNYQGLYGLKWMQSQYPDDYQAILWLRDNVTCENQSKQCNNQPVILEANGDSYTDYARVSANTGLPTVIGWPVHEWLWRGSYDEAGKRIPEVATVYESEDLEQTKQLLKKYNVDYIFLGNLEREKYKNLNETKLENLGKVIFQNGDTKIIKVYPGMKL